MSTITIPNSLLSSFVVSGPSSVRDESGKVLGHYTPVREATEEDYQLAISHVTPQEVEQSLKSGECLPFAEGVAALRRKFGPA